MKLVCKSFRPLRKNTLFGFAEVHIAEFDMVLKDIAVHEKGGSRWAAPPARPQLSKDGAAIKDAAGKIQYSPIIEFASREARDRFSAAVISAVCATDEGKRALGAGKPQDTPAFDDAIPF
jgi:hypothetical protein